MNVLFFHKNAIHPNAGGISRITYNLVELFRGNNINVKILAIKSIKGKDYQYDSEQYFLPNDDIKSLENINFTADFVKKNDIKLIINQSAIDITSIDFLSLVRVKCNCKIISCFHNSIITPVYNYPFQKEWVWKKTGKKWLFDIARKEFVRKILVSAFIAINRRKYLSAEHNSDAIVFLCNGLQQEFDKILGKHSTKTYVIPNFTDIKHTNTKKNNTILWIGTVDFSVKRIDFILKVWSLIHEEIPEWNLKILGDGFFLKEAEEYANTLGVQRCSFEGRVNPNDYYNKAKISCVTSSHEAFSMVIIESLAHGVIPIVNNSFPAASMLIDDNVNGVLVTPFSIKDFSSALLNLINTPHKIEEMSLNALESANNYTGSFILDFWKSLFNTLSNND